MGPRKLFVDRRDAGRVLAGLLLPFRDESPIILGLPRGGVPVAAEVANLLGAPLDVCVVRKVGAPVEPELGIGAVSEGGAAVVDEATMREVGVSEAELADLIAYMRAEVDERVRLLRRGAPPLDIAGRTVIVVDDGIATGGTARAAVQALRARGAGRIVLAAPVGAADSLATLATIADEVICPHPEAPFIAVGLWYRDFAAVTDADVIALLDRARREAAPSATPRTRSERVRVPIDREVRIAVDVSHVSHGDAMMGRLTVPTGARALVLFAHGSGSSRHSARNKFVASELQSKGLGTLLLDLLTEDEERLDAPTAHLRFDIPLLASRLLAATDWVCEQSETSHLSLGYFGASTGAAAALMAAAARPAIVRAIVSRGGRPDLAEEALGDVRAPTLLLVGGDDPQVLQLNRESLYLLGCVKELEVVRGATHLFEEPGTLEQVAHSAAAWFVGHLGTYGARLEATA
jgi:putative phosphoribosyl transferase